MKTYKIVGLLAAFVLVSGIPAITICAGNAPTSISGEHAKIKKKEAKKIALAKVPGGKIKEAELEKENGKLIWSFDIATLGTKTITEVHVDALTGEVLSVEKETPSDEKKEKDEKK